MIIVIIIIYLGWSEWALQADGVAVIELEKKMCRKWPQIRRQSITRRGR